MEEILELIEGYGLSLFSKHHETNASNMEEIKKKIDIILEYIRKK